MARTKAEVIESVKTTLKDWALGDIYKALLLNPSERIRPVTHLDDEKAALRGAFILGCSLLDAMSCYYFNAESTGERFRQFCVDHEYMPGYNFDAQPNDLYYSLRCGMLHNYQPSNVRDNTETVYALTHGHPEKHLHKSEKIVWINLQNFIADIHAAVEKFFAEIDREGLRRDNTFNWAKEHGWFGLTEIETSPAATPALLVPAELLESSTGSTGIMTNSASSIVFYRGPDA